MDKIQHTYLNRISLIRIEIIFFHILGKIFQDVEANSLLRLTSSIGTASEYINSSVLLLLCEHVHLKNWIPSLHYVETKIGIVLFCKDSI